MKGARRVLNILHLCSGTNSTVQAFIDRGHNVVSVDNDASFHATYTRDVLDLTPRDLRDWGPFDFAVAGPPCEGFSVASIGRNWTGGKNAYIPASETTRRGLRIATHVHDLISTLGCPYVVENPRGLMRKTALQDVPRVTVTYCQYGDSRMKPTDLFSHRFPRYWGPRPVCKNGDPCHDAAPRGSKTGTQGLAKIDRSRVPYDLSLSLCIAVEKEND